MLVAAVVAVVALYRAGSFIHELTHLRKNALPGFRLACNILVGVPLLIPSFMYEGIHSLHHNRTKYGTVEDPEYLPLALMKPWTVPLRSEEHTSELQSLIRISYAVFFLKKKKKYTSDKSLMTN